MGTIRFFSLILSRIVITVRGCKGSAVVQTKECLLAMLRIMVILLTRSLQV